MKPYPDVVDSGIKHAEDWEECRWGISKEDILNIIEKFKERGVSWDD